MTISTLPKLYTEAEAAEYLRLAERTLQRKRRCRQIGFIMIGRRAKYKEQHLLDYLESQECKAPPKPGDTSGSGSPTNIPSSSAKGRTTGTSNGGSAARSSAALAALRVLSTPA
jgi:excisionase family DNA binding protein